MYLVVFRNRKRADIAGDAYDADAQRMLDLAASQPGFVSVKTFHADDGEVVTISEWADEAAAKAWGRNPQHAMVMSRGLAEYYQCYTLYAMNDPVIHRFEKPDE